MAPARDRLKPLRVYVTPEERAAIEARAQGASQTVSNYLRTLGVGHEPKSTLDQDAILALVRVHADQGRLGGLLKLWLSEKPGQGASVFEVRKLLRELEAAQAQLKTIVRRL